MLPSSIPTQKIGGHSKKPKFIPTIDHYQRLKYFSSCLAIKEGKRKQEILFGFLCMFDILLCSIKVLVLA